MQKSGTTRVVPLDEMDDFKVADGEPDVRGWDVVGSDGRKIGEVDQLLIDRTAMKVRYLDVDMDDDLIDVDEDRHVLIPIGYARLDRNDDNVLIDSMASKQLIALPAYRRNTFNREYETDLRSRFDSDYDKAAVVDDDDDEYYEHEHYDEDRFYGEGKMTLSEEELAVGKREARAGAVEVEKHVDTEHVSKEVPVMHEEVTIERRPATGRTDATIEEGEIRVPLTEEEVVVGKRTVAKEELVINKQQVQDTETVEADLRKERVEIEKEGDVRMRDRDR
jgi:uncharacterized protein (TIGR02271 family)